MQCTATSDLDVAGRQLGHCMVVAVVGWVGVCSNVGQMWKLHKIYLGGGPQGLVVSVIAREPGDPSLNPSQDQIFFRQADGQTAVRR